ncbi:unnamed protein product, partial [Laminaria digitata]
MSVEGAGAVGGGGGGGFDTDSSDEDWCGRGGGLRDFERGSAENTRRALLKNDAQLCEPPPLPPLPPESDQQLQNGSDSALSDGSREGRGQQQQQQQQQQRRREPPLRFVPGDPFANEKADVGAWARHFTYLAVVPSGTAGGSSCCGEKKTGATAAVVAAAAAAVAVPSGAGRAATLLSTVAAAAAEGGAEEDDDEEENERRQGGQDGRGEGLKEEEEDEGEEEGEIVYASHGVYEEYLAYDCRPPGRSDEIEGSQRLAAEKGARVTATTAAAAAADAATPWEGQGRWPSTTQEGDGGASRPRPGTPQRELRQEIMDRLFDEVWERLTPDLVLLLELDTRARAGGGGGGGRPGEGQR